MEWQPALVREFTTRQAGRVRETVGLAPLFLTSELGPDIGGQTGG